MGTDSKVADTQVKAEVKDFDSVSFKIIKHKEFVEVAVEAYDSKPETLSRAVQVFRTLTKAVSSGAAETREEGAPVETEKAKKAKAIKRWHAAKKAMER